MVKSFFSSLIMLLILIFMIGCVDSTPLYQRGVYPDVIYITPTPFPLPSATPVSSPT